MDNVFKAIADPARRALLDALMSSDGQTLRSLADRLPEMTRQGVMNHLGVLEAAGLITTRRHGREKHHFLNPIPIRQIHDRWIDKYTGTTVAHMIAVARTAEGGAPMPLPDHVYTAYVAAPAAAVWEAITDGERTERYFYGTRVESTWSPGDPIAYRYPDGTVAADGEILAIDPGARVEMTFHARWDPALEAEGPVRQVWAVTEADGVTTLTVETYEMPADSKRFEEFSSGLPFIVSGLKTLVETGAQLV